MKRSTRILIVFALLELSLAGVWWWLLSGLQSGDLRAANNAAETIATVSSTIGTAMGVLAGVLGFAWIMMRRKGL